MDRGNSVSHFEFSNPEVKMNKRIVILGAGESGTGASILAKVKGFKVFVSDAGMLKDKYRNDLLRNDIEFEEGKHSEDKILNADLIIKSPGIPENDLIKKIQAKGIEIIDEIEFGFRYTKGNVIAITGTNGKTTTTLLIYHLLKEAGYSVALGGNVGESLARKVAHSNHDWYVLEISSFQLDGIKKFKPVIGILLNITPDHLDRYGYDLQKYIDSKFQLIQNMDAQGHFIYYGDDQVITSAIASRKIVPMQLPVSLKSDAATSVKYDGIKMNFSFKEKFSIAQSETTLKGSHNLINTMAAVAAVYLAGAKLKSIQQGLKTFKNAPHRLEFVATINGVDFINDSKATNVDSVIYALGSYDQPLIWIAGGIDKGNDYNLIKDQVAKKVKTLICLGKDNGKLLKFFDGVVKSIHESQNVSTLVRQALQLAQPGDMVLLSPACASFDLFKDYKDRGDQFRIAVLELKKEVEKQLA